MLHRLERPGEEEASGPTLGKGRGAPDQLFRRLSFINASN